MSFVEKVQKGDVSQPTHRSFDLLDWHAAFEKFGSGERCKNLYEAGLWIYQTFTHIRTKLRFVEDERLDRVSKLQALISYANLHALNLHRVIVEIAEQSRDDVPERATIKQVRPTMQDASGVRHSMDEIAQSCIDGLELPIKLVLQRSHKTSTEVGLLDFGHVFYDANLGVFYKILENHWEDCLWNEYRIETGKAVRFAPGVKHLAQWKVITQYRRNILTHSLTSSRLANFFQCYEFATHTSLGLPRLICRVDEEAGIIKYILSDENSVSKSSCSAYLLMIEALEPYYSELVEFRSEILDGTVISQVIQCWAVLESLTRVLVEEDSMLSSVLSTDDSESFGLIPAVDRNAFISVIADSLKLEKEHAERIIEFLTYHGKKDEELWAQPLIRIAEDKLHVLVTPVLWGTTQRNVNVWLKQMGADLTVRGTLFESYVRDVAKQYIAASPIRDSIKIIEHRFKLPMPADADIDFEDIDLLIFIEDVVIVGEVKCFLPPADTVETFSHREKVIAACGQLQRKIRNVDSQRKTFRDRCLLDKIKLPENFRLIPIVLLSGPMHCGLPYGGVPIIDLNILAAFLKGIVRRNITIGPSSDFISSEDTLIYHDVESAKAAALEFFSSPPQLDYVVNGLVERDSLKSNIISGVKDIYYSYYDIDL